MDLGYNDQNMSPPSTTSYLPGYLLGGNTQSSMPMSQQSGRSWSQRSASPRSQFSSPGRVAGPTAYGTPIRTPQPQQFVTNPKLQQAQLRGTPTISRTPKDSIGAPPVEGLYDAKYIASSPLLERKQLNSSVFSPGSRSSLTQTPHQGTPGTPFRSTSLIGEPQDNSPPSPAQVDPFYTQGDTLCSDDVLSDSWVTVFGFPPAAASYILEQFSQYGNIMKHEVMANKNWMHIQYQSKLQAKKALSKHGKVYGGNLMIAVVPCIEKSIMQNQSKDNIMDHSISDITMKTVVNTPSRLPIRPLTAAYQAASSNNQVVPQDGKTPQKSDTIMSKAMEYMFGW